MSRVLTEIQIKALNLIMQDESLPEFYLSGGTALAEFYLQHRLSEDLDFFCNDVIDGLKVESAVNRIKTNLSAESVRYEKLYDRRLYFFNFSGDISPLKIEFTQYPFTRLAPIQVFDSVRVDSLQDIAANKLMALLDRFEPKDFVDLHFLSQKFSLQEIRASAGKKFGLTIAPLTLGSELMKVDRVVALPNMLESLDLATLKNSIHDLAKQLKSEIIEE